MALARQEKQRLTDRYISLNFSPVLSSNDSADSFTLTHATQWLWGEDMKKQAATIAFVVCGLVTIVGVTDAMAQQSPITVHTPGSSPVIVHTPNSSSPPVNVTSYSTPDTLYVRYPGGLRYHTTSHRHYYSRPIFRFHHTFGYSSRPLVVVNEPSHVAVVDTTPSAYESGTPVVYEKIDSFLSLSIRLLGFIESDTNLTYESIEGTELFGAGAALRIDLIDYLMLEVGMDVMGVQYNGIRQLSVPLTVSFLPHLYPDTAFDPYAVAGFGVVFSEFDDPDYHRIENFAQLEGHLGLGLEINLDDFLVTTDARYFFLQPRPDRDRIGTIELAQDVDDGEGSSITVHNPNDLTDGIEPLDAREPDDISEGFQFMVGFGWRF